MTYNLSFFEILVKSLVFYNRLFIFRRPKFCRSAKLASCIVVARGAVKLGFTTVYSSTSAPNFACNKLV